MHALLTARRRLSGAGSGRKLSARSVEDLVLERVRVRWMQVHPPDALSTLEDRPFAYLVQVIPPEPAGV
jgi:hypothetical protein